MKAKTPRKRPLQWFRKKTVKVVSVEKGQTCSVRECTVEGAC